jgi:2-oxo-4-hydroxy-4-carboxy--5-ureidoimidazoline (OHCU) decarboxylase
MKNSTLPSIPILNHCSLEEFTIVISLLFEPCPLLTDLLFCSKPFTSYDQLISRAETSIQTLSLQDKVFIVNAHPRLGAPKEILSSLSFVEQGYHTNTKTLNNEILKELEELNALYEAKHKFKVREKP